MIASQPSKGGPPLEWAARPPFLFGVVALLGVVCYGWLAVAQGDAWLWDVAVHESGRYTLGETVLYARHFLREVPVDVGYALFLCAAAAHFRPAERGPGGRGPKVAGVAVAVLVGGALVAAVREAGWNSTLLDLGQYRTRDDLVAYGSHWRFHWLSSLWFGVAAWWTGALMTGRRGAEPGRRTRADVVAWSWFALMTLVFGLSSDVFLDVRYAGHQVREIATHGVVTLALGWGVILASGPITVGARGVARALRGSRIVLAGVLLASIPAYLAMIVLQGDVLEVAQADLGLSAMVAGHVFEHTLDYVLVVLLTYSGYRWLSSLGQTGE